MLSEWQGSGHSQAASSALYQASRQASGDPSCDGCHLPLAGRLGASAPAAREGVTCDACHTLRKVTVAATARRADIELATDDMIRYGPLCDLEDHYFHRMGCSPLHREGELCAACHLLSRDAGGTTLPVFTEYSDWKAGPYAAEGIVCQACHMPGDTAEVAVGSPPRDDVPHHGFLGRGGQLRQGALGLTLTAVRQGAELVITTEVSNRGAGHFVPAGLPERRLALETTVLDKELVITSTSRKEFGRTLTDDGGQPVPFYRATKVGPDTRIGPRQSSSTTTRVPAAGASEVRVRVVHTLAGFFTDELATLGRPDEVMIEARLPLAKLPASVTVPK
ncbi:MAG: hypothetical protein IT370_27900 [Deltaproteobacteria bacterium]|nr:hypothetical protein [Deltaproteobacteria bacterium]